VTFSGDKLLGGPQAGIIAGHRALIDILRRHPLMRAVRPDKLTLTALANTLALWAEPERRSEIPVYRMLTMTIEEIDRRAREVISQVLGDSHITIEIIDGFSTIGGGSAPGSHLATRLVAVSLRGRSASDLEHKLRQSDPPIVGRIENGRIVLDLRTVD